MPVLDQAGLEQLQGTVASVLGTDSTGSRVHNGALLVDVPPVCLRTALLALRDNPRTRFDILSCITAVDYFPRQPRFELAYELFSLEFDCRVRIKVPVEDTGSLEQLPQVDSVHDIYLTANWHERECCDLMGIHFTGHPDLRRILLPDRWDGHPLRKEEPFDGKPAWQLGCTVEDSVQADSHLGLEVAE